MSKKIDKKTRSSYAHMISRCYNKNNDSYFRYGAVGITVCEKWKMGIKFFIEDMGLRPDGKSLDRIDPKKGYYKENCRWATPKEQRLNNRGSNKTSNYKGVSYDKVTKKWRVSFRINGKSCNGGRYTEEISAAKAYDREVKARLSPEELKYFRGNFFNND